MSSQSLFAHDFQNEIAGLPRPHPSFIVSLLGRSEPAIVAFRTQIESWWSHLDDTTRSAFTDRLCSLENDVFFQAFAELAVNEIFRYHDIRVLGHAARPGATVQAACGDGPDPSFGLGVLAYLPEVQIRGSMSVYRHLVRELNGIHHHYNFSVYLKRWLPYDFDPRPIKRALEVWLDSLDDGSWHGKYAEYRDENIHLEFSILDKLNEDRRNLVRFRISPLRAPEALARVGEHIDRLVTEAERTELPGVPLVATLFSNEEWTIPENFLHDYVYGKADYSFNWTTHRGRTERLKSFTQKSAKYGLFTQERLRRVSALIMCDKEWERDKVVFSLRVHHNPWAEYPLESDLFGDFAQYRPVEQEADSTFLAWANLDRARFRLP